MNQIISALLAIIGLIIIVAPEYLVPKDGTFAVVHDYHQFIGVGLLFASYYIYANMGGSVETGDSMEVLDQYSSTNE